MSFISAAMWSVCAISAFDVFFVLLQEMVGASTELDLVSRVLCEAAGFVGTLFLLTLVHERERPLSDVLALRRTPVLLLVLAVLVGIAMQGPINLMTTVIYDRYPLPDEQVALLRHLFDVKATHQRVAIVVAAGVIGPVVEEMLFRGGILRGLLRRQSAVRTVIGIAVFFALAHREPRNFLPDFVGGVAMGYARIASGSLWPAIAVHAAFNTTSVALALLYGPDVDVLTRGQNWIATALWVALGAAFLLFADKSELCAAARGSDVAPET
ncbi:MAG: CPBP family intramembrane glutamic endopeptidase [Polyangiaceae bacterium]